MEQHQKHLQKKSVHLEQYVNTDEQPPRWWTKNTKTSKWTAKEDKQLTWKQTVCDTQTRIDSHIEDTCVKEKTTRNTTVSNNTCSLARKTEREVTKWQQTLTRKNEEIQEEKKITRIPYLIFGYWGLRRGLENRDFGEQSRIPSSRGRTAPTGRRMWRKVFLLCTRSPRAPGGAGARRSRHTRRGEVAFRILDRLAVIGIRDNYRKLWGKGWKGRERKVNERRIERFR